MVLKSLDFGVGESFLTPIKLRNIEKYLVLEEIGLKAGQNGGIIIATINLNRVYRVDKAEDELNKLDFGRVKKLKQKNSKKQKMMKRSLPKKISYF